MIKSVVREDSDEFKKIEKLNNALHEFKKDKKNIIQQPLLFAYKRYGIYKNSDKIYHYFKIFIVIRKCKKLSDRAI